MDEGPDFYWLEELCAKLWNRKDLEKQLFREVVVTKAHYDELENRLKAQHPDRDLPDYDGARHDVRSIKLDILRMDFPASPQHPDNNEDQVDDSADGLEAGNEDVFDTNSLFPFTLNFLDLSTLDLKDMPKRLPYPLYVRKEYEAISVLIKKWASSVLVSGQPGTGEVLQLSPYLTASNQLADIKARPRICTLRSYSI